jgi:hypothetical protein
MSTARKQKRIPDNVFGLAEVKPKEGQGAAAAVTFAITVRLSPEEMMRLRNATHHRELTRNHRVGVGAVVRELMLVALDKEGA